MPLYDYKCDECGFIEEVLQNSNDPFYNENDCPNCGESGIMARMISVGSFHLKGGGWAKDGYVKKPQTEER